MTCPVDDAGNNLCMELMRRNLAALGRAEGLNCEVIFSDTEPDDPDTWDAPFLCFHGVRYWVRPTDEQLAEWDREEDDPLRRIHEGVQRLLPVLD